MKVKLIHWVDSSMIHEQTDYLPRPQEIHSVGWVATENDNHIMLVRDHHWGPNSDPWRGSIAIPRSCILYEVDIHTLI